MKSVLSGTMDLKTDLATEINSPRRYQLLRRKIVSLMALVTILPLLSLAGINYYEHQNTMASEIQAPLRALVGKAKHSFELFLAERTSAVSFIASAYTFDELSSDTNLQRIFQVMRREFTGFVDLGLIDTAGNQISYAGPYDLKDRNYTSQDWFHQVQFKGTYVSDVFLGFRKFPHVVIAVRHTTESGQSWILRATLDTMHFDRIIAAMGLEPGSDAFLLNRGGILQTESRRYGKVLGMLPFALPPTNFESNVQALRDDQNREIFLASAFIANTDFALAAIKPRPTVFSTWYTVRADLLFIFVSGVIVIFLAVYRLTSALINRLQHSDEQRMGAIHQMEHSQKLSSIGRLAAGVAHEINNPLAIINEKAGLMRDIMDLRPEFPDKDKFSRQIDSILRSVDRCRGITHRMLGFAKRMDVKIETLDLNSVLEETLGFLEREAQYRNVEIRRNLVPDMPSIPTDHGQIQQVFLNILNNALAAVPDGGRITLTTWDVDENFVGVSIEDNGCGMSEETAKNMFEPFFTTKKEKGTGLGMSITYGIVKRLGGELKVQSKLNEGTTMTILLPKKSTEGQA
ncbi:MAG: two-component sensor histidine kinase [Desulfomicrobium sp.]|nr:two-component sensor histidine kinase [Pseudomonadota bacterium]MBV1711459.1 two-component sensor histidine kinase [Desulfomicrobium sp.]MBU4570861.1 two-component sensor histidine kinase [Pseudomonadota bacterium]MBU4595351.1 two-component sensor histidine kinase [Pseudomonadota bacterium]MBV1720783.1 two-component sensor histidine kinase [Desulfomicrobium sp.]